MSVIVSETDHGGDLEVIDESEEAVINAENERQQKGGHRDPHSQHKGLTRRDVDLLSKCRKTSECVGYIPYHKFSLLPNL